MNVTPVTLLEHLALYTEFLRPGGRLIATLKFIGTGRDRKEQLSHLQRTLEKGSWMQVECLWLLANTKSERMVTALHRVCHKTSRDLSVIC